MKTQTILLAVIFAITTLLCIGCEEEQLKNNNQETELNVLSEIETKDISEEKRITKYNSNENFEEKNKIDKEPLNLLDTQAKVYTDIFGKLGGVEELQGIEGYMDLVEKMDASPETKKQLTEQYELYSNSLDPKKKEVLKKQLLEALKPKN